MGTATIRDVARQARVSIATVSRVMNNTCLVSEDKRRRVLAAVEKLEYSPNPAALSLLNKKTGGIGVLLPYVSGEFFSEILNGLDEAAQNNGFFLVVSTSHRHPEEFKAAIQAISKRVDGLIIMAPELDTRGAESLLRSGEPVSFVNTYVDGLSADVLNFDNYGGAYALTRHLLELGHRRVALIKGPPGAGDASERARGYRHAMAEAGLSDTSRLEFEGDYTQAAGYAAVSSILGTTPRPSAILAANDYCAMGTLSALHEAGIAVPEAMAVAGFDGISSARYTVPPLTTVRVPMHEMGYRAVSRFVARLGDDAPDYAPRRRVLPVDLVVRASTMGSTTGEKPRSSTGTD